MRARAKSSLARASTNAPKGPGHLKRILTRYFDYYHRWCCHQSLEMDCPCSREVHPIDQGRIVEIGHIGGLHHHYGRIASALITHRHIQMTFSGHTTGGKGPEGVESLPVTESGLAVRAWFQARAPA